MFESVRATPTPKHEKCLLQPMYLNGVILFPWECLAMSGTSQLKCVLLASGEWSPRMLLNTLQCRGPPAPKRNDLDPGPAVPRSGPHLAWPQSLLSD